MPSAEEKYRRLPGRRRGVLNGSSLWMGSDHILLVRTAWFREEYKRFYLRDIQAIVVARCPRFYFSVPMLIGALLWLLAGLRIALFGPGGFWPRWSDGAFAMAVVWLSISLASSCRCRLYTAVSKDELPSLYRTWTARRFLSQVTPRIEQVQGVLDAARVAAEGGEAGPVAAALPAQPRPGAAAHSHNLAADLFVISLLVGPLVGLGTLRSAATTWSVVNSGFALAQIAGAVAVLVEHYRGRMDRGMQRTAIATLVLIGVMFYVQAFTFPLGDAAQAFIVRGSLPPFFIPIVQVSNGLKLLLGFIGAAIILRGGLRKQPDIIKD
jgi:hypothetical protein